MFHGRRFVDESFYGLKFNKRHDNQKLYSLLVHIDRNEYQNLCYFFDSFNDCQGR